jgi:hypothetical protein
LIVLSFAAPPSVGVDGRKNQRKAAFGLSAPRAKRGSTPLEAGLDFRPLHSIYLADCFDHLQLLMERYRAYAGRKVRRHHIIIFSY